MLFRSMHEIVNKKLPMTKEVVSREKALKMFEGQPYKQELIRELDDGAEISVYHLGDVFCDLCKGPHVENTSELKNFVFNLALTHKDMCIVLRKASNSKQTMQGSACFVAVHFAKFTHS